MADIENRFRILGVDHIVFAVYDRNFWEKIFKQFGFGLVGSPEAQTSNVSALIHGDVRVALVDPESSLFNIPRERVTQFLQDYGDMQVISTALLIDNLQAAREELASRGVRDAVSVEVRGDGVSRFDLFGKQYGWMELPMPRGSTSTWRLIARPSPPYTDEREIWKSRGVDHFAIGVDDVDAWAQFYESLGFDPIYTPDEISGDHSGMKTIALKRDEWVVALVEGVDHDMPSQVSTYVHAHGDHAIQHAAIRYANLPQSLGELSERRVQLRLRRSAPQGDLLDFMHEGQDHSGPLLQCFTKPWARRATTSGDEGGFFFELIQRTESARKADGGGKSAFHDPTVIGLYRSIEQEEIAHDAGLILPADLMEGYAFDEWLRENA